jgi:hypothetical protein
LFKSAPARFLLWCVAGTALAQGVLQAAGSYPAFSAIFRTLIGAYDTHGNALLLVLVVLAFLLRRHEAPLALVRAASAHPWAIAAVLFVFLCAGSLRVYHDHALSMDEYVPLFQARVFAEGRLDGRFPPPLLDLLVPVFFQGHFFSVSHASGAVTGNYWPGFALWLTPFVWAGVPWAANPALGALAIPLLHRLALRITQSDESAGWAVLLALASPVFIVTPISYYSMQAHLLCNLVFALLLLTPSPARATLAGVVGSVALTLHNPVPHLLFAPAFLAWLAWRREWRALLALAAGYVPLSLALGAGWHYHVGSFAADTVAHGGRPFTAGGVVETAAERLLRFIRLPEPEAVYARVAGLAKAWTWGAAALFVLAAYGVRAGAARAEAKVLAWALAVTFFGYFVVRFDQGHGWGYRYLHSAWFVLPLLGAIALMTRSELRPMAAWCIALSLVFANGLRLVQVESFVGRHLAQVPPLARAPDPSRREIVFVNVRAGFYAQDLVQNDPFLRGSRMVMVYGGPPATAAFMASRFPAYARQGSGEWGELWAAQ